MEDSINEKRNVIGQLAKSINQQQQELNRQQVLIFQDEGKLAMLDELIAAEKERKNHSG